MATRIARVAPLLRRRAVLSAYFALLTLAISYRVLPISGILTYGDYPYFWPHSAFDSFSTIQSSFLGQPRPTSMFVAFFAELPALLSAVMPHALAAYLLTYGLLYGAALTTAEVTRRLLGRVELAYLAGTMLVLSNVTMEYLVIQPSHIFAALLVLVLTVGMFTEVYRRRSFPLAYGVGYAVATLFVTHPLFWAIGLGIAATFFLVAQVAWHIPVARCAAVTLTAVLLFNAYWLVPFLLAALTTASDVIFSGGQDAIFEHLRQKTTYVRAFAFLQMGGDWGARLYQGHIPYLLAFGSIALGAGTAAVLPPAHRRRGLIVAALVAYLLFLSFSLGPNSPITGDAWAWAYRTIPGFGLLRHFTRLATHAQVASIFVVVTALAGLAEWRTEVYRWALGAVVMTVFITQIPFFSGDLNGSINTGRVPVEYAELNARYLDTPDDFVIATFPSLGYEGYTWAVNSHQDVFQQPTYFKELYFKKGVVFNRYATPDLNVQDTGLATAFAYDAAFVFEERFDDDLNRIDARYVLVQKDQFDIERSYRAAVVEGRPRPDALEAGAVRDVAKYLRYFSANPAYRLVEENGVWALFENTRYLPRIRGERIAFQRVNDAKYRVYVQGLQAERAITFLQRFDENWRLYAEPVGNRDWCAPIHEYPDRLVECARGRGHQIGDVARLWQRSIDVPHGRALGYANEWRLSSAALQAQLAPGQFSANPDGTIDVVLTLMYRPQAQFYAGLLVSGIALGATALGGIAWLVMRRLGAGEATRTAR